jgi:hypothetical protein
MTEEDLEYVDKEVKGLLEARVVVNLGPAERVDMDTMPGGPTAFVAPTFPIPKKNSDRMRVIIDHLHVLTDRLPSWFAANLFLSKQGYPVRFPKIRQFMAFLSSLVTAMGSKNLWATVWDLTGAYHQANICMYDAPLTAFIHRGEMFVSGVLDFGGKPSPGRFSLYTEYAMRMVRQLFGVGGKLLPRRGAPVIFTQAMLDDFFVLTFGSRKECMITAKAVRRFLESLGFRFNQKKE